MKIAFIHNYPRKFRMPLFKFLDKNFDVDFFFYENTFELKNVKIIDAKRIKFMSDFFYCKNLICLLENEKYDLIISTDLGYHITHQSYKYALKNKIKFILWNEEWDYIHHPRRYFQRYFENKILKNSYEIWAFGQKHKQFLENRVKRSYVVMPNVCGKVKNENFIKVNHSPIINITMIARLKKIKGHKQLLLAFNKINNSNCKLNIYGDGEYYKVIKKIIKKNNIQNVNITKKVINNQEKNKIFETTDIFVLPSTRLRTTESWGLMINEAAEFGLSVIVSNKTGVADELVINNKTGLIFEDKNIEEFSNMIERLVNDIELRKKLGNNLKKQLNEKYSNEVLCSKISQRLNYAKDSIY